MGGLKVYDYNYLIICVDRAGNEVERIGEMNGFPVADAAFEAALKLRTNSTVVLREGARRVKAARTGSYDSKTQTVPVLSRES